MKNAEYSEMIIRASIATLLLSTALILYSIIGYVAVRLEVRSLWLPLWLSIFQIVYLLAFVLLPAGCLESYLMRKSETSARLRTALSIADVVIPMLLLILVLYIQNWFVMEGRRQAAQEQPSTTPSEALAAERLPSSQLSTLEGNAITIQEMIRGTSIAVLVFWASYDSSWSSNLSTAESVFQKYKSLGCVVIGINEQEGKEIVATFVRQKGISFPVLLDSKGEYVRPLRLPGSIERVLVVDPAGRIVAYLPRTQEVTDHLSNIVEKRLSQQKGANQ